MRTRRDLRSSQCTVRDWAAVVDQHHRMVVALTMATTMGPASTGVPSASG
ncbi:MAG: hypothetical protein Q8K58_11425 [Acidimicrobiales bacterium]|nr:hypothetical protein [Acidimicrobiales bacterium]